jgi:hypothetical protein
VAFICFLFGVTSINAQTKTKSAKPVVVNKQKSATKVKKDGTPDMRYKENKESVKPAPAGPAKKDGTPDMRYKENKKPKK